MGGQKGQNVPFSRKNEYFDLEFFKYTLNCVGKLTFTQLTYENLMLAQFRSIRGQNGGQKGQSIPFSRKNEYFELEFSN